MVKRDSETGQFVAESGGENVSYGEQKQIGGVFHATFPAADMSGGKGEQDITDETGEIVSFSPYLENDEVFRLYALKTATTLSGPTTGTAESSMEAQWAISRQTSPNAVFTSNPYYTGSVHREEGQFDIATGHSEENGILTVGELAAESSLNDTTNGTGAGSSTANTEEWVTFTDVHHGGGPVFDRDDELYHPVTLMTSNISDHAVNLSTAFMLTGEVEKLD